MTSLMEKLEPSEPCFGCSPCEQAVRLSPKQSPYTSAQLGIHFKETTACRYIEKQKLALR